MLCFNEIKFNIYIFVFKLRINFRDGMCGGKGLEKLDLVVRARTQKNEKG